MQHVYSAYRAASAIGIVFNGPGEYTVMSTNADKSRLSAALRAQDEPGVYGFRVFYLRVNGRRSVVGGWQLYETLRRLKLLHMYSRLEKLDDTGFMQFDATVHGEPLAVSVIVGTWQVRLGAEPSLAAARASG